jgi:hypothetical protein
VKENSYLAPELANLRFLDGLLAFENHKFQNPRCLSRRRRSKRKPAMFVAAAEVIEPVSAETTHLLVCTELFASRR